MLIIIIIMHMNTIKGIAAIIMVIKSFCGYYQL